jgi:hypothetical protein
MQLADVLANDRIAVDVSVSSKKSLLEKAAELLANRRRQRRFARFSKACASANGWARPDWGMAWPSRTVGSRPGAAVAGALIRLNGRSISTRPTRKRSICSSPWPCLISAPMSPAAAGRDGRAARTTRPARCACATPTTPMNCCVCSRKNPAETAAHDQQRHAGRAVTSFSDRLDLHWDCGKSEAAAELRTHQLSLTALPGRFSQSDPSEPHPGHRREEYDWLEGLDATHPLGNPGRIMDAATGRDHRCQRSGSGRRSGAVGRARADTPLLTSSSPTGSWSISRVPDLAAPGVAGSPCTACSWRFSPSAY